MLEWLTAQAVWLAPVSVIAGAISAVLGVIYGIYRLRKAVLHVIEFFLNLIGLAEKAVTESQESKAATHEGNEAIVFLSEQLGQSKAAQDWMALRNDDTLAALLKVLARLEHEDRQRLPARVQAIEHFLADREAEEHKQGAPK